MLRNVFRNSRWLVRRKINSSAVCSLQNNPIKKTLQSLFYNNNSSSRLFSSSSQESQISDNLSPAVYDKICTETLESLSEYFEELIDQSSNLKGADVTFSDGVLTVALGSNYGTYVINRQTPNKQIWLSSPTSGPKRYDLILDNGGYWLYKHDGVTLHQLLQNELSKIVDNADFGKCSHAVV
ncbi:frataxin homolog, mitochondrial [Vanessa cardui]|uniref:frataxin homolog, mitochondrial n=1 Tax=Vanessa cardui TaxID=171605 RepID=UPI001F1314FF|nr:frataxin homolog, mitochondrial [Vanessa cardui]